MQPDKCTAHQAGKGNRSANRSGVSPRPTCKVSHTVILGHEGASAVSDLPPLPVLYVKKQGGNLHAFRGFAYQGSWKSFALLTPIAVPEVGFLESDRILALFYLLLNDAGVPEKQRNRASQVPMPSCSEKQPR